MGSQYGIFGVIREVEFIDVLGFLDFNVLWFKFVQWVCNFDVVGFGDEWIQCGIRFVSL